MKVFTSSKTMLLVMALLVMMASNAPSGVVMAQPTEAEKGEKEQEESMIEVEQMVIDEAPAAEKGQDEVPAAEAPVVAPTNPIVTEAPVPAPTEPPVVVTEAPVPAPTEPPVVVTEAPVPAPTEPPVVVTEAPVPAPTDPPVVVTEAPVPAPTDPPVVVTEAPVPAPTDPPVVVTEAPVPAPTEPPVVMTAAPTNLPATSSPTAAPVQAVVPVPPTAAPVAATSAPTSAAPTTAAPTSGETAAPTASPTAMPTFALTEDSVEGLGIALDGVALPLSEASIATFESTYAIHCTEFFSANIEQVSKDVQDYSTTITYVKDKASGRRRKLRMTVRSVQETGTSSVLVTYNQDLQYRADPEVITLTKAVQAPFMTESRRQTFADLLVASGDPAYENLQGVGKLEGPGGGQDPKSNTNAIIIGVCAGVGGLLLLGGGYMLYKRQAGKSSSKGDVVGDDDKPPSQLAVSTAGGDDGVSTLAEPAGKSGTQSGEELAGYGDQSVATVDYDYSKAYGGGGEGSVVSSAGGTLGQQTSGGGTLAAAGVAAAGGASIFSDDASFEQNYAGNVSVKEEMIEVYAPPGKLGVVIDTPDEGAPVVHAIKDSSCIADQLQVGDKLIAVDDEDVRAMTAIKVSKMISRKSANAQRKLTIVRTTVSQ